MAVLYIGLSAKSVERIPIVPSALLAEVSMMSFVIAVAFATTLPHQPVAGIPMASDRMMSVPVEGARISIRLGFVHGVDLPLSPPNPKTRRAASALITF